MLQTHLPLPAERPKNTFSRFCSSISRSMWPILSQMVKLVYIWRLPSMKSQLLREPRQIWSNMPVWWNAEILKARTLPKKKKNWNGCNSFNIGPCSPFDVLVDCKCNFLSCESKKNHFHQILLALESLEGQNLKPLCAEAKKKLQNKIENVTSSIMLRLTWK